MEKFYVASSFRNIDAVSYVTKKLVCKGYVHTYDWTKNAKAREGNSLTLEDLKEIGQNEKMPSWNLIIVILLPGGKGTHIELGIALGLGKKIFLHSPDGAINHIETTSTFYHLPEVEKCYGTLDELVEKISDQLPLHENARK